VGANVLKQSRPRTGYTIVLLSAVALGSIAVIAATVWVSLRWRVVTHDAVLMHYVAWGMLHGLVPYRDMFEINYPGTYVVHWGILALPGNMDLNWRLFDLGMLASIIGAMKLLLRGRGNWAFIFAGISFALWYLGKGSWFVGERDTMVGALELMALVPLIRALEQPQPRLWPVLLSGALFGLACMIKPTVACTLFFVAAYALYAVRSSGIAPGRCFALLAAGAAGVVIPGIATAAWLWSIGGLQAFIDLQIHYVLPVYSRYGGSTMPIVALGRIVYEPVVLFLVVVGAVVGVGSLLSDRRPPVSVGLLTMALIGGLVHLAVQRKGFVYHMVPAVAAGTVLSFWHFQRLALSRRMWNSSLAIGVLCWLMITASRGCANQIMKQRRGTPPGAVAGIIETLRPRLRPGDTLQPLDTNWGAAEVLLRLGLRMPTRQIYDFPLLDYATVPFIQQLRQEFMQDFESHPPRFVLVSKTTWAAYDFNRLQKFPALTRYLQQHYTILKSDDEYRLYERKSAS